MRLVTRWSQAEIDAAGERSGQGSLHPRDAKMKLAREIVAIYHGDEAASQAEEAFVRVFQQKDTPDEMPEYHLESRRDACWRCCWRASWWLRIAKAGA